jgi:hypothetical protein
VPDGIIFDRHHVHAAAQPIERRTAAAILKDMFAGQRLRVEIGDGIKGELGDALLDHVVRCKRREPTQDMLALAGHAQQL